MRFCLFVKVPPLLPIRRPLVGAALGAAVAARDAADGVKSNGGTWHGVLDKDQKRRIGRFTDDFGLRKGVEGLAELVLHRKSA